MYPAGAAIRISFTIVLTFVFEPRCFTKVVLIYRLDGFSRYSAVSFRFYILIGSIIAFSALSMNPWGAQILIWAIMDTFVHQPVRIAGVIICGVLDGRNKGLAIAIRGCDILSKVAFSTFVTDPFCA